MGRGRAHSEQTMEPGARGGSGCAAVMMSGGGGGSDDSGGEGGGKGEEDAMVVRSGEVNGGAEADNGYVCKRSSSADPSSYSSAKETGTGGHSVEEVEGGKC